MIFSRKLARLVAEGRKTQTRRKIKEGETTCRYKPGRHYALQVPAPKGSKKRAVTRDGVRLEIIDTRPELVSEISYEDALAEGFDGSDAFFDYWRELHGPRADLEAHVWVIQFRLFLDAPRLLHVDSSRGYTSNQRDALPDEPEAVDPVTQAKISGDGLLNYDLVHAEEVAKREIRAISAQLKQARSRALKKGLDVTPEVTRIRAEVEKLQERVAAA